jgi:hypothetical protein
MSRYTIVFDSRSAGTKYEVAHYPSRISGFERVKISGKWDEHNGSPPPKKKKQGCLQDFCFSLFFSHSDLQSADSCFDKETSKTSGKYDTEAYSYLIIHCPYEGHRLAACTVQGPRATGDKRVN